MKKFRVICLSLLLCLCGLAFSACQKSEAVATKISLPDFLVTTQTPTINLLASQKQTVKVLVEPKEVKDKSFEAMVIDTQKTDFVSFEYDLQNMQLTIVATDSVDGSVNVPVKLQCKQYPSVSTSFVVSIFKSSEESTALSSPEVSFDGSKNIQWNSVEGAVGYQVEIYADDQLFATDTITGSTSFALQQAKLAGKNVVAKVKAKGKTPDLDSEFSVLNFSVLSAPKNLAYNSQTGEISWDQVPNATGYELKIGSKIAYSSTNKFDAIGYFDIAGTSVIAVRAVGTTNNAYLSSLFGTSISVTKLDKASNLHLVGDVLMWNVVGGATGYDVVIANKGGIVVSTSAKDSYFDLSALGLQSGQFTATIVPKGPAKNTIQGDARQFSFSKLEKISGFRIENGILKWDPSATGYRIFLNGVVYDDYRKVTTFDAKVFESGINNFNIVARGNDANTISSDPLFDAQNPLKIYKLLQSELLLDGNGDLSWTQVANASGYAITVGGSVQISRTATQTDAFIALDSVDFSVPVEVNFVAKGDQIAFFDGAQWTDQNGNKLLDQNGLARSTIYLDSTTQSATVQKLSAVNLQFGKAEDQAEAVIWAGTNNGGYMAYISADGALTKSEQIFQNYYKTSEFCLDEVLTSPKVYSVVVIAKASTNTSQTSSWFLDSDVSNTLQITKLPKVDISVQNGQVVWSYAYIDNIANYTLKLIDQSNNSQKTEVLYTTHSSYDFSNQNAGEYAIEIVANAKANTAYISSSASSVDVTKLASVQSVNISKTSNNQYSNHYDTYRLEFADQNNGNATYIFKKNGEEKDLSSAQGKLYFEVQNIELALNTTFSIQVLGDSQQFLNGATFEFTLQKTTEPAVYVNASGTKVKCMANHYLALFEDGHSFSSANNEELETENGDKFIAKAIAITQTTSIQNGQEVMIDSEFTPAYGISKLSKPQFFVKDGVLQVECTDSTADTSSYKLHCIILGNETLIENTSFSNLNSKILESFGTCAVKGYFTDSKTGDITDGTLYLRSEYSEIMQVKKLPKPANLTMIDGFLHISFEPGKTIDNGKIAIFCNNAEVSSQDNTSLVYNFAQNNTAPGVYKLKVQAKSAMSGHSAGTVYALHGDVSAEISVTKLAVVDYFEVTAFAPESDGTVANLAMAIQSAIGAMPNNMPVESGAIRWKAVENATQYQITNIATLEKMVVKNSPASDGYIYVNLQNSMFGSGTSNITIKTIGNKANIVDSEVSDQYTFAKLKAPTKLKVSGDGVISWTDENNPNNSALKTTFGQPIWLLAGNQQNAFIYVISINDKYGTAIDLYSIFSDMSSITGKLKNLSYQLSLNGGGVSVVKVCAMPFNSCIDETVGTVMNGSDAMTWKVKKTDSIYVSSDFSNEIYVKPALAPFGLTLSVDNSGDEILSWTNPYSVDGGAFAELDNAGYQIKGYTIQLLAYDQNEDGKLVLRASQKIDSNGDPMVDSNGEPICYDYTERFDIDGANTTSWNFSDYLKTLDQSNRFGTYSFVVKTVVTPKSGGATSQVTYLDSGWSLSYDTTVLKTPDLGIYKGQVAWAGVAQALSYKLQINGQTETIAVENGREIYIFDDAKHHIVDGTNIVKITAIGDGKKVISSAISDEVSYIKLKTITTSIDNISGVIKYTSAVDESMDIDESQWNYYVSVDGFDLVVNAHNLQYDLSADGNIYDGGRLYTIAVEAKNADDSGELYIDTSGSSDKKYIINSGLSNQVTAYKLKSPTIFGVDETQQSITWKNQDAHVANVDFVLDISGSERLVKTTAYYFETEGEVNGVVSVRSIYRQNVTIDGTSYACIRSDKNEKVNIQKLNAPTSITMQNGILHWENVAGVETRIVYGYSTGEFVDKKIEDGSYNFADITDSKTYSAHLYSRVSDDKLGRVTEGDVTSIYLSSMSTPTFNFQKLARATAIDFVTTFDGTNATHNLSFAKINNASQYELTFVGITQNGESTTQTTLKTGVYDYVDVAPTTLDVTADFKSIDASIASLARFGIQIVSYGSTTKVDNGNGTFTEQYVQENGQYYVISDANKIVMNRIEAVNNITINTENGIFTGRADWTKPTSADGNQIQIDVEYYLYVTNSDGGEATQKAYLNNGAMQLAVDGATKIYKLATRQTDAGLATDTYCQFAYSGQYSFKIIAEPINAVAVQNQATGEYSKIYQSVASQSKSAEYRLFADGEGLEISPYIVENYIQFNYIKYNPTAFYKLVQDINYALDGTPQKLSTIPSFAGSIDGNGKTVYGFVTTGYAGIVGTLEEGGKIINLTVGTNTTTFNTIATTVGGIVGTNNGQIDFCLNRLNLSMPSNSKDVYVIGGIAGTNNGSITRCGNMGSLYGNIVGGICAQMFAGNVDECYNGNGVDCSLSVLTTRLNMDSFDGYYGFVGGIVAYATSGTIDSTYCNSTIFGDNSSNGTVYVGGIAGYTTSVSVSCSYAVSKAGSGGNYAMIDSAISTNRYVGILVGYVKNYASGVFASCASIYSNEQQALSYAVGNKTLSKSDGVNGYSSGSALTYSNVYKIVSQNGQSTKFESADTSYPKLSNAKYS